jgi:hypothetical protein
MVLSALTDKLLVFWHKYENLNLKVAFVLISLQLVHLYWLTADVVIRRITQDQTQGLSANGLLLFFFVVIDYIEIPGLAAGLTYYAMSLYRHREHRAKNGLFLIFLIVQVFHIFWITDEIVYESFFGKSSAIQLPYAAVWVAILIDYLELPVIADLKVGIVVLLPATCGDNTDGSHLAKGADLENS